MHFVSSKMDAGLIIKQKSLKVKDKDTETTLANRILQLEHILYPEVLNLFASQNNDCNGNFSNKYFKNIKFYIFFIVYILSIPIYPKAIDIKNHTISYKLLLNDIYIAKDTRKLTKTKTNDYSYTSNIETIGIIFFF